MSFFFLISRRKGRVVCADLAGLEGCACHDRCGAYWTDRSVVSRIEG